MLQLWQQKCHEEIIVDQLEYNLMYEALESIGLREDEIERAIEDYEMGF